MGDPTEPVPPFAPDYEPDRLPRLRGRRLFDGTGNTVRRCWWQHIIGMGC